MNTIFAVIFIVNFFKLTHINYLDTLFLFNSIFFLNSDIISTEIAKRIETSNIFIGKGLSLNNEFNPEI